MGERGGEHHRRFAVPAVLELLELRPGESLLDIGAGQGVLAPHAAAAGANYTGVDASERLVRLARRRHGRCGRFLIGDARRLRSTPDLEAAAFDAAVFLLSIQDMDDLEAVLASAGWALRRGGRLVLLMRHPCFRIPRQSGWGWDRSRKLEYRRIDRYLSPLHVPNRVELRGGSARTLSFHRPLSDYVNGVATAGLVLDGMREIAVPRWDGERSRFIAEGSGEIPLFLGLRAFKLGRGASTGPGSRLARTCSEGAGVERCGWAEPSGSGRAASAVSDGMLSRSREETTVQASYPTESRAPSCRAYLALAAAAFQRYATYRQAMVAAVVTNSVFGFLRFAVMLAVIETGARTVAGYDEPQLATFVWAGQGLIGVVLLWALPEFAERIRTGDVITDLLRPIDPVWQLLAADLGRAGYAVLTRFVVPVVVGALAFDLYAPRRPVTYALFAWSMLLATIVCFGCRYLVNAAAYWLLDVRGPQTAWTLTSGIFGGLYFPIWFFPDAVAIGLIVATPFPSVIQIPLDILVERGSPTVQLGLLGVQAGWVVVLLALCRWVQKRGERKLVIQGG